MGTVHDCELNSSDVFRIVWTGWFWGLCFLFGPFFLLTVVALAFTNPFEAMQASLGILLLPVIAGGQGLMAGAVVVLGLWVHRRFFVPKKSPVVDA